MWSRALDQASAHPAGVSGVAGRLRSTRSITRKPCCRQTFAVASHSHGWPARDSNCRPSTFSKSSGTGSRDTWPTALFRYGFYCLRCVLDNLREWVQAMPWAVGRANGKRVPRRAYAFEGAVYDGCPLRPQCVKATPGRDCTVSLHPQEGLLQEARTFQASAAFAPYRAWCQVAGHRLACLVQIGPAPGALLGAFQDRSPTPADGDRGQSHPRMGPGHCLSGAVGSGNSPDPGLSPVGSRPRAGSECPGKLSNPRDRSPSPGTPSMALC